MKINIKTIYKIFGAAAVSFILMFSQAHALTSLFYKVGSEEINKGDSFNVDLNISSNKSINVIDGTLTYDKNKLAVENIDTKGSILTMWQKSPTSDNKKGTITFVGGVPGGYKGEGGHILSITFIAKSSGIAKLDFQDIFSVYLNDGLGTEVNPWVEPMNLTILPSQIEIAINKVLSVVIEKNKQLYFLPAVVLIIVLILAVALIIKMKKRK